MYSTQHSVYDSDSAASFSSSTTSTPSPPVDGIILSDNVQDWFQLNQSFQSYEQEVQQSNTVYCDTTVQDESHWQYNTNGQAQNSSYTYIFDSLPDYSDSMESKGPERKTAGVKRRRVQNPHQRKAANIRERRRMSNMNEAFDELKKRLPAFEYEKKLSRIETLKLAMTYISFMKDISDGNSTNNTPLFHCQQNLDDNLLKSKEKCP